MEKADSDGIKSSVARLQISSDKSKVSLSTGALQFYLLHVTPFKLFRIASQKADFQRKNCGDVLTD